MMEKKKPMEPFGHKEHKEQWLSKGKKYAIQDNK